MAPPAVGCSLGGAAEPTFGMLAATSKSRQSLRALLAASQLRSDLQPPFPVAMHGLGLALISSRKLCRCWFDERASPLRTHLSLWHCAQHITRVAEAFEPGLCVQGLLFS